MEFVSNNLPVVMGVLGSVVWLVRLEGKAKSNEKRLDDGIGFKKEVRDDLSEMKDHMSELRNDIKWFKEIGTKLFKKYTE